MNGECLWRQRVVLGGVVIAIIVAIASSSAIADPDNPQPRWYFRLGFVRGVPQLDSFEFTLRALPGLKIGASMVPTSQGSAEVEPLMLLGGPIGLVLPVLNHRLAVETIVAIPQSVKVVASGKLANESILPTVLGAPTGIPPLGREIAEVNATSPLLTFIYRVPSIGPITPLVGAGFAALLGFDVRLGPVLKQYVSLKIDSPPSLAPIAQAGADIRLWHRVQARIDVKYLALSPQIKLKDIQAKTGQLIGTIDVGDAEIQASVHAWLVQAGVGFDM